jgi:hypothetical protein
LTSLIGAPLFSRNAFTYNMSTIEATTTSTKQQPYAAAAAAAADAASRRAPSSLVFV